MTVDEGSVCRSEVLYDHGSVDDGGDQMKARNVAARQREVKVGIAADGHRVRAQRDSTPRIGALNRDQVDTRVLYH